MTQGTKIVAVVLFVLFVGTGIYYVTLSPAKPASPSAPKATVPPANAVERNPGSITMGMPSSPSSTAADGASRVADPLAAGSGGGTSLSAPTAAPAGAPLASGTPSLSGPVGVPSPAPAPTGASGRVALGPAGTPTSVMPPLTVSRSGAPSNPKASGVTAPGVSTVRPASPPSALSDAPTLASNPSAATSASNSVREHVVASGDTLSSIAARYLGSEAKWEEIAKANPGINPNAMKVGAKLSIPSGSIASASSARAPSTSAPAPTTAPVPSNEYVVKAGDTLTRIARQTLGSADWESIYEANRSVIGPNPAALRVGMKLSIPKRS